MKYTLPQSKPVETLLRVALLLRTTFRDDKPEEALAFDTCLEIWNRIENSMKIFLQVCDEIGADDTIVFSAFQQYESAQKHLVSHSLTWQARAEFLRNRWKIVQGYANSVMALRADRSFSAWKPKNPVKIPKNLQENA